MTRSTFIPLAALTLSVACSDSRGPLAPIAAHSGSPLFAADASTAMSDTVAAMRAIQASDSAIVATLKAVFAVPASAALTATRAPDDQAGAVLPAVCRVYAMTSVSCASLSKASGVSSFVIATTLNVVYALDEVATSRAILKAGYSQTDLYSAYRNAFLWGPSTSLSFVWQHGIYANMDAMATNNELAQIASAYNITDPVELGRAALGVRSTSAWIPALRTLYPQLSISDFVAALTHTGVDGNAIGGYLSFTLKLARDPVIQMLESQSFGVRDRFLVLIWFGGADPTVQTMRTRWNTSVEVVAPLLYEYWFRNVPQGAMLNTSSTLQRAGYSAFDVSKAIGQITGTASTPMQLAAMLKTAGYQAFDVAAVLKDQRQVPALPAGQILHDVGYTGQQTGDALQRMYGLDVQSAANALQTFGYTAAQTLAFITSVPNAVPAAALKTLQSAGYAVEEVGKAVWGWLVDQAGSVQYMWNNLGPAACNAGSAALYFVTLGRVNVSCPPIG